MIYQGDCRDVMRTMEANSIDCIVTDPPYGLSFMGKEWDHGVPGREFWEIALQAMKPGAFLLAFGGTRTFHRLTCAIEDAGFEVRDCIQWIFGSGFPKSHNLHGDWEGWGTALKPAYEPIMVCRKPLEGTVAQNVLKWGTGAMNIDGGRIATNGETPTGSGNNLGYHGNGSGTGGNTTPSLGRWPANVILDEEAGAMLDGQSGTLKSPAPYVQQTKVNGEVYGLGSLNDKAGKLSTHHGDTGGASRFFYCAKASKRERNAGLEGMPTEMKYAFQTGDGHSGKPSSIERTKSPNRQPTANNHPTVKPLALLQYLIKLVCPPNGIVLDPFLGSGSTAVAAQGLGFRFIGIEKEEKYCEIAKARLGLVAA